MDYLPRLFLGDLVNTADIGFCVGGEEGGVGEDMVNQRLVGARAEGFGEEQEDAEDGVCVKDAGVLGDEGLEMREVGGGGEIEGEDGCKRWGEGRGHFADGKAPIGVECGEVRRWVGRS